MSRSAHILTLLVATVGLSSGCIPVVRTSVVRYGVEAKLVDAETGAPIAKQRVQVAVDGQERTKKTDKSGAFRIAPERHHYWAWLMGGPYWGPPRGASIQETTAGYTSYRRDWAAWPQAEPELDQNRLKDGYITVGSIELTRRQPDGAANGATRLAPVANPTLGRN
jgi:hypothetical protein